MSGVVYLNGRLLPRGEARVPVDDRGFTFGDGVYEVFRAFDGRAFEAGPHLRRLQDGLRGLEIQGGEDTASDALLAVALRLLDENGLGEGHVTVYIQVTRGAAPRTHYFPPAGTPPTVYLSAARFTPPAAQCEHGGAAITHPDLRWERCDLKTINLLPNILAKQKAVAAGATEAVLVRDGVVTEGSHTSVFAVVEGELRTHPLSPRILPGVTRDLLLRLAAEQGIPASETAVSVEELAGAEEVFVAGTTMDVTPIVRLDGRPVGDGYPGPVARALYGALTERITSPRAGVE
ncbi:MAG TPA: aminotransferase class IV [Longimicrobiaceae bacterium]|nr:aminotransferase class IV [Longimicrobiaceae bacterium]